MFISKMDLDTLRKATYAKYQYKEISIGWFTKTFTPNAAKTLDTTKRMIESAMRQAIFREPKKYNKDTYEWAVTTALQLDDMDALHLCRKTNELYPQEVGDNHKSDVNMYFNRKNKEQQRAHLNRKHGFELTEQEHNYIISFDKSLLELDFWYDRWCLLDEFHENNIILFRKYNIMKNGEPLKHMDFYTIKWMESYIRERMQNINNNKSCKYPVKKLIKID